MRGLLLAALLASSASAQTPAVVGHWEGALHFRGDETPVRLHVAPSADSLLVTLDLPALLMAWEPLPARRTARGVEATFPFGLGALAVEPDGDAVHTAREVGGDTLTLDLVRAEAPPFRQETVTFRSGDARLVGTLVLPDGPGPHPGVVLIHGSAPHGRHTWAYRSWADLFARAGVAVLLYDKRGVGESGGERGAGLRQLADDAIAAVGALRARPEVDAARVGLKGGSQGVWLAEQVAADLGDVAFLVLASGAGGTPRDQEMQQVEYGMRDDGRPEAEIEDALAYLGLYFYVARTGEGWPLLATAAASAQTEPWGEYVDQPESLADLDWWHENHAFQPATVVPALDVPALLLYGGADWIVPPVENAERLHALFPSPERVEVHIFPGADHRLEVPSHRDADGAWHWPQIAPGALEAVTAWLRSLG